MLKEDYRLKAYKLKLASGSRRVAISDPIDPIERLSARITRFANLRSVLPHEGVLGPRLSPS
jgi:hypothetical protein